MKCNKEEVYRSVQGVICVGGQEAEVNGHLFLHCNISTDLWNMFFCILRVNWTMPRTTFEVLTHCKKLEREDQRKICLKKDQRKIGGRTSLLAFSGHYGRKGMRDVMKRRLSAADHIKKFTQLIPYEIVKNPRSSKTWALQEQLF
ncbi:hypothetical protein H5410_052851 [Solanum commersonii]|uniref:Uncharacterized protein n=1 Tax=Solanum commersonii TaxID=4109 RepID=A0A9J5X5C6_SOLCO|nr:hypothetical protein H5410_052851 [Solanum commersonii]